MELPRYQCLPRDRQRRIAFMNSEKLKIAVTQMTSLDVSAANVLAVESLFVQAAKAKADLVVFPENTLFFRIRAGSKIPAMTLQSPEIQRLQSVVDAHSSELMLTTPLAAVGGKSSNSTIQFRKGQSPKVIYTKVHLFDVDVEGAPAVRESEAFVNGPGPAMVDVRGWKVGLSICYDLRFSELYLNYSQKADVVLVPSAFLVPTGEAHWHTLLRARAIEGQYYVVAPAQKGEHVSGDQIRRTYGHALAVDPWGKVLGDLDSSPEMKIVELSREAIVKVRRQIPMEGHRRL